MDRYRLLPNYHYEDIEGTSLLTMENSAGELLRNLKIYGASSQDGEPSADNPVPIVSVGDKTKNLFDIGKITETAGIANNGDGSLTISKYGTKTNETIGELCPALKVGDVVTLSFLTDAYNYVNGSYVKYLYMRFADGSNVVWGNGNSKTITQEILDAYIIFYCTMNADETRVSATTKNIQIEEGETATDYEPYGYRVPVEMSGKNLLDKARSSNEAMQNETAGQFWGTVSDYDYVNALLESNTTYTLSYDIECTEVPDMTISDKSLGLRFNRGVTGYSQLGSLKSYQISKGETLHFSTTFSTPSNVEDGKYRLAAYSNYYKDEDGNTASATVIFKNIQLEKSETETGYEAYVEPVITNIYIDEPLRKVGDTQDMLDVKTGILTRIVEVIDDTGEKTIDESLGVLETPEEESTVPFDEIKVLKGDISIKVLTEMSPSKTEAQIYKY